MRPHGWGQPHRLTMKQANSPTEGTSRDHAYQQQHHGVQRQPEPRFQQHHAGQEPGEALVRVIGSTVQATMLPVLSSRRSCGRRSVVSSRPLGMLRTAFRSSRPLKVRWPRCTTCWVVCATWPCRQPTTPTTPTPGQPSQNEMTALERRDRSDRYRHHLRRIATVFGTGTSIHCAAGRCSGRDRRRAHRARSPSLIPLRRRLLACTPWRPLLATPVRRSSSIDTAIAAVSTSRGTLGAVQNRLESTINNLSVTTENLAASESRIRDTDMAAEMVNFTKNQILQQAGTAMFGQANAVPQSVLSLLR